MGIQCHFKKITLLILMMFIIVTQAAYAKNPVLEHDGTSLGVFGKTYSIQEDDLLDFILHRIQIMQQNGEWQKLQNQFRDNVSKHADRPQPVFNLAKATTSKSWNDDPSITVPYDLRDSDGRVFAKAGTTINPLKIITIHKALIFFDGDDKNQVMWADNLDRKLLGKSKLILVSGSVSDQVKQFQKAIYFDQEGKLTSKFHIHHVPAVVMQEGIHLRVTEVAL